MDLEDVVIPLVFGQTIQGLDEPTTERNRLGIEKTP
jgi:hypothetical protein